MSSPEQLATALADRYRIVRELGAGGMATVYLAEDLKHDRKVAIKVLKPELAAVLGADRFVVEIKTTAAMSHPHILPLFDSGTADGFLYYVMPYIEGETIRDKLTRETQFSIVDAVRITREIAEALDYAHRRGIIHRDIKPENILLHDGRAMVMDFGIALAVSAAAGGRMTETGLSLGTPHYMSPEQATAEKEITPRSDIFSLASVCYEMLAGEPPHSGGSAQAIIMKIIAEPVALVTKWRKSVPPHVAAALDMALQKVPADRFESAAAFAAALANPAFTTSAIVPPAGVLGGPRGVPRAIFAATAAVALVATAAAAWGVRRSDTAPSVAPSVQFEIDVPDSVRVDNVAVSPDGSQIVIAGWVNGRRTLLSRLIDDVAVREIPGTDGGAKPFHSPDGAWIAYVKDDVLYKVPRVGGSPQRIASIGSRNLLSSGTWGADGTIVYATGDVGAGLYRVAASGGTPTRLTTLDSAQGETVHRFPRFLADGRTVAFAIGRVGVAGNAGFGTVTLDGRMTRQDWRSGSVAGWTRDSLLVYTSEGALAFSVMDPRTKTMGEVGPQLVTGVMRNQMLRAIWDLSANGTLVVYRGSAERRMVAVSRSGASTPMFAADRRFRRPKPSPDGQRVVVELMGETAADRELWMLERRAGTLQRLTFGGAQDPVWTADGRRVVFTRRDSLGGNDLYWQPADGSGGAELLLERSGSQHALAVLPDGSGVVFDDIPANGSTADIWLLPLTGDRTPRPILVTEFSDRLPSISPDGKWMAYTSNESGRGEVYVRPFPGPGAKVQISVAGGDQPTWGASGSEIFYRDAAEMIAATVQTSPTFTVVSRTGLFVDRWLRSGTLDYDVLPGGGFAMLEPSARNQMLVITNWVSAVTRDRASGGGSRP